MMWPPARLRLSHNHFEMSGIGGGGNNFRRSPLPARPPKTSAPPPLHVFPARFVGRNRSPGRARSPGRHARPMPPAYAREPYEPPATGFDRGEGGYGYGGHGCGRPGFRARPPAPPAGPPAVGPSFGWTPRRSGGSSGSGRPSPSQNAPSVPPPPPSLPPPPPPPPPTSPPPPPPPEPGATPTAPAPAWLKNAYAAAPPPATATRASPPTPIIPDDASDETKHAAEVAQFAERRLAAIRAAVDGQPTAADALPEFKNVLNALEFRSYEREQEALMRVRRERWRSQERIQQARRALIRAEGEVKRIDLAAQHFDTKIRRLKRYAKFIENKWVDEEEDAKEKRDGKLEGGRKAEMTPEGRQAKMARVWKGPSDPRRNRGGPSGTPVVADGARGQDKDVVA